MTNKKLIAQLSTLNPDHKCVLTIVTEDGRQINTDQFSVTTDEESGYTTLGGKEVDFENVQ